MCVNNQHCYRCFFISASLQEISDGQLLWSLQASEVSNSC